MENKLYSKVFLWLFVGLMITFITGYYTSVNEAALNAIFKKGMYVVFIIIEVALALILSIRLHKMSATTAKFCYLLYTFISGLTFSSILVEFKLESIMFVFGITSVLFLIFAVIGLKTNIDLSKLSTYLLIGLFGIIIASILNIFINSETFNLGIVILSILIFVGYTAFDIQRIKQLEGTLDDDNVAILGAFNLYLDFINIFIDLLRLFGESDN